MSVVSADGHFGIPEGTITIVSGSWEEWGVDRKTVKTVTFPATVTSIGRYAFFGCILLVTVTIPDSVTSIGGNAFNGCRSLVTLTIPDNVTNIGESAFSGCSSLVRLTIPESVTTIEYGAFNDCSSLVTFTIPGSVTSIGGSAFEGCSSLVTVTIPDSVASIEWCAFYECSSLVAITIPDRVANIGNSAFDGCSALARLTIPETVATIGSAVFGKCHSLATLLVQPAASDVDAANAASFWNKVFEVPKEGDDFYDDVAEMNGEVQVTPLANVTRVWAPDAVIKLLTGPFKDCSTFSEVPRAMRAAPDATTWAAVQLWFWWSPPTGAGYTNRGGICKDGRIVCSSRHATLFTTMVGGSQAASAGRLQVLPEGVWLLIFGWLKHDEAPTFPSGAEAAAAYTAAAVAL